MGKPTEIELIEEPALKIMLRNNYIYIHITSISLERKIEYAYINEHFN